MDNIPDMSPVDNKSQNIRLILLISFLCICILFSLCICVGSVSLVILNYYRKNRSLESQITDSFNVKMSLVPSGVFTMGQYGYFPEESPIHTVYLNSYYIDVYEVTNGEYKECVAAGICKSPLVLYSKTRLSYFDNPQFSNFPVIYVTWEQSVKYCEWRGARLPTEAEWEKAARGTDDRKYPWGSGLDCNYANYNKCNKDTTEVGKYTSGVSPYGLYDMAGNVWEWVSDWRSENYYEISPSTNPQGPNNGIYKVLRGGSWNGYEDYLRVSYRGRDNPVDATNDYGFRCAKDVTP